MSTPQKLRRNNSTKNSSFAVATAILLLKTPQYRILEAQNGGQARDILGKDDEIDLLFTSGFNGSTMHGGPALAPADELLIKPYRRDALASKLREVLGRGEPPGAG